MLKWNTEYTIYFILLFYLFIYFDAVCSLFKLQCDNRFYWLIHISGILFPLWMSLAWANDSKSNQQVIGQRLVEWAYLPMMLSNAHNYVLLVFMGFVTPEYLPMTLTSYQVILTSLKCSTSLSLTASVCLPTSCCHWKQHYKGSESETQQYNELKLTIKHHNMKGSCTFRW